MEEGKSAVLVPVELVQLLGNSSLVIQRDDLKVELSPTWVERLLEQAGWSADAGKIKLSLHRIDGDESESLLEEARGSVPGNANVSFAGPIYRFHLEMVTEEGEREATQFPEALTLYFTLHEQANLDLAGIYYITAEGELQYVGGTIIDSVMAVRVDHFSHYAVLEYDVAFADVSAAYWAADVIRKLAAKHIVQGVTHDRFKPEGTVTRAEFVTLISRALELTSEAPPQFDDVPADAWYADAVAAAYEAGIIKGRSDAIFAPSGLITREEMAVMILRAYEYATGKVALIPGSHEGSPEPFIDQDQVSEWASHSVKAAQAIGLIHGRTDGTFAPQAFMTRAEAAQIIWNLLTKL
jgi:hypothetical protein